jgi:hypothetical protein
MTKKKRRISTTTTTRTTTTTTTLVSKNFCDILEVFRDLFFLKKSERLDLSANKTRNRRKEAVCSFQSRPWMCASINNSVGGPYLQFIRKKGLKSICQK